MRGLEALEKIEHRKCIMLDLAKLRLKDWRLTFNSVATDLYTDLPLEMQVLCVIAWC